MFPFNLINDQINRFILHILEHFMILTGEIKWTEDLEDTLRYLTRLANGGMHPVAQGLVSKIRPPSSIGVNFTDLEMEQAMGSHQILNMLPDLQNRVAVAHHRVSILVAERIISSTGICMFNPMSQPAFVRS